MSRRVERGLFVLLLLAAWTTSAIAGSDGAEPPTSATLVLDAAVGDAVSLTCHGGEWVVQSDFPNVIKGQCLWTVGLPTLPIQKEGQTGERLLQDR